ncbi:MAG: type II secretion system protein GspN [Desulforhopalus sp.]
MVRAIFSLRFLFYLLYGVALTAVLLYVRFPTEKFRQYCEKRFEKFLPGTVCTIDRVVYRFPLSAVMRHVHIRTEDEDKQADLNINQFVVTARPPRFFSRYSLASDLLAGNFSAKLNLDKLNNGFQLNDIDIHGLDVGAMVDSLGIIDREMSGLAEFSGNYEADSEQPFNGNGKGTVKVVDGSVGLLQPILGLTAIEFESVVMGVSQEKGIINLAEARVQGKDIAADFTGQIRVESPLVNSNLLLSGQLEPQEPFLRNNPREQQVVQRLLQRYNMQVLPFKVGGTLSRPLFRFSK